jgi:hypothetical protein
MQAREGQRARIGARRASSMQCVRSRCAISVNPVAGAVPLYLQICDDIQAWIPAANNAAPPRFNATLNADMNEAQGSQLGSDLAGLNSDLLTQNTLALQDSASIPALSQDCQTYGVTLNWQAGM